MKFYGQCINGSEIDKIIYNRYFHNKKNGFFIECGAYDGILDSCCKFFEDNFEWTGINIEPLNYIYDKLKVNRNKCININAALYDSITKLKFVYTDHIYLGCGSLNKPTKHLLKSLNNNLKLLKYQEVNTITYKNIIEKYKVSKVDLFVLDVEGEELRIINSMSGCILPDVFVVEYGHVGLENAVNAVKKIGYVIDYKDSVNIFCIKK